MALKRPDVVQAVSLDVPKTVFAAIRSAAHGGGSAVVVEHAHKVRHKNLSSSAVDRGDRQVESHNECAKSGSIV